MNKKIIKDILSSLLYIIFYIALIIPGGFIGFFILKQYCELNYNIGICELSQSGDEKGLLLFISIGIFILWIFIGGILYKQKNK